MSQYPPVPYVPQRGNTPRNDCGPACCLMLAQWNSRAMNATVAQWSAKYDPTDDGTTAQQLALCLRVEAALTPVTSSAPYPHILLVDYASLPLANRSDKSGRTFLHWILRLSDTTYHDPYWWNATQGANLTASKSVLDAARRSNGGPPVTTQERPHMARDEGDARTPYDRVYHVIPPDTPEAQAVEIFRAAWRNNRQTVGSSYDDAGLGDNLSSKRAILYNIPSGSQASFTKFFQDWYASTSVQFAGAVQPPPVDPPPQPSTHPALPALSRNLAISGMHTINWIEDARDAFNNGCRVVTMLDNLTGAREMRDKGCAVIHRTWFNDPGWSPEMCVDKLGVNADDRLIVVGQNECDAGRCPGDVANLRARFEWDKRFAELIWQRAPKCFPAIGGFSVGTPPIDAGGDYARVFRETYAAFCNANAHRVGINWHLYVWRRQSEAWPPAGEQVYPDQRWWAGRTHTFAYDPNYGGLNANVISVSDEIGTESGHGGMNWAGFTDADALRWWAYWRDLYLNFTQLRYATVFIGCRSESWRGYDVRYLWPGAFRSIWGQASTRTAPMSAEAMQVDDYVSGYKDAIGRAMYDARMKQKRDE